MAFDDDSGMIDRSGLIVEPMSFQKRDDCPPELDEDNFWVGWQILPDRSAIPHVFLSEQARAYLQPQAEACGFTLEEFFNAIFATRHGLN
jgi:hypothetical protein